LWSSYYYPPAYYPYYYPPDYYYPPPPAGYYYPPPAEENPAPSSTKKGSSGRMFIYPRQGQTEEQQARDFNECQNWAVGQTGFDPTKPPTGPADAQVSRKSEDFLRAISACLDGRGYTLK
jgi:hypothetical protein